MPWKETCPMVERIRFVTAALEGAQPLSRLCVEHGISRTAAYKWLERYEREGWEGLEERSRAPLKHGLARSEDVVTAVLGLRERYPYFGPRKLRKKLKELMPSLDLPARSTIGDWLRKEGLTHSARRRRRCPPYTQPFASAVKPNDLWCADFKGWFRTGDGVRCDPLTVSDAVSRYILRCRGLAKTSEDSVKPVFEAAFREFGLPMAIRTDNGVPFAAIGAGGLSRLAVWWIKLGIACERIEPGRPQQNGRHERMHRTLKKETASPPEANLRQQQQSFDRFCQMFNYERPHEALEDETPASVYRRSPRRYPCRLQEPEYPDGVTVRRVRSKGDIKWRGELVFVSQVLAGEPVAITETANGDWEVRFATVTLGFLDPRRDRLCRNPRPTPQTAASQ